MLGALLCASLLGFLVVVGAANPCSLLTTEYGSVCRCNSSYCDTVPSLANLNSGQYQLYSTSKSKLGFASTVGSFSNTSHEAITITIKSLSATHQTIIGFGGAFTDATGINIVSLPEEAQQNLLRSYFGDAGIGYSLGRVPIGGTDFSLKGYTYCDEEDPSLSKFALQEEDFIYKIPLIQKAKKLRGNNSFQLFASAWSSPAWTKSNKKLNGDGFLLEEYYQLWANYYLKFFDAYSQNNISFWGVTTQNEPYNSGIFQMIPNIGFNTHQMIKWVTQYLGPAIRNSSFHSDLKIILHDDQRSSLLDLKLNILSNDKVLEYADGIGVHWYTDFFLPASLLNLASSDKKHLFRLGTEACEGFLQKLSLTKAVELGNWDRAETYLNSIIDDLKYDFVGWMDWNMVLNETGGPTYINNNVDSPIIVNATNGEFYKQPMFYAFGHFSKFLVPASIRVDVEVSVNIAGVDALAFQRPDGLVALIMRNRGSNAVDVNVNILGSTETFVLDDHSINTLLYSV